VGGLSSSGWSGGAFIWYGLYGSPAICRWKESIIFASTGCNRRLMVLSYFISDTSTYIVTDSILKKNKDVSPFDGTKPSTYNFVLKHEYHGGGGEGELA
jgi:hypothetical protein